MSNKDTHHSHDHNLTVDKSGMDGNNGAANVGSNAAGAAEVAPGTAATRQKVGKSQTVIMADRSLLTTIIIILIDQPANKFSLDNRLYPHPPTPRHLQVDCLHSLSAGQVSFHAEPKRRQPCSPCPATYNKNPASLHPARHGRRHHESKVCRQPKSAPICHSGRLHRPHVPLSVAGRHHKCRRWSLPSFTG